MSVDSCQLPPTGLGYPPINPLSHYQGLVFITKEKAIQKDLPRQVEARARVLGKTLRSSPHFDLDDSCSSARVKARKLVTQIFDEIEQSTTQEVNTLLKDTQFERLSKHLPQSFNYARNKRYEELCTVARNIILEELNKQEDQGDRKNEDTPPPAVPSK